MPQEFHAVLWDMDGTIIDSTECHFSTWMQVMERHGYTLERPLFDANFGRNSRTVIPIFLGFEPEPDFLDQLMEEKAVLFRKAAPVEATLIPGVESWLNAAHVIGLRQAVASSGPLENIVTMVRAFHLSGYFDDLVSGAALPAKPEPDIFLKAAERLGVPPEQCLVVEDVLPGVKAAKQAGMTCIAVTTTKPREKLRLADFVVDNFTQPFDEALDALSTSFRSHL